MAASIVRGSVRINDTHNTGERMAQHLYVIGETVALRQRWGVAALKTARACVVKATLPPLGDSLQYRIKCEGEPHERIALEDDLIRPTSLAIIAATFTKKSDSD